MSHDERCRAGAMGPDIPIVVGLAGPRPVRRIALNALAYAHALRVLAKLFLFRFVRLVGLAVEGVVEPFATLGAGALGKNVGPHATVMPLVIWFDAARIHAEGVLLRDHRKLGCARTLFVVASGVFVRITFLAVAASHDVTMVMTCHAPVGLVDLGCPGVVHDAHLNLLVAHIGVVELTLECGAEVAGLRCGERVITRFKTTASFSGVFGGNGQILPLVSLLASTGSRVVLPWHARPNIGAIVNDALLAGTEQPREHRVGAYGGREDQRRQQPDRHGDTSVDQRLDLPLLACYINMNKPRVHPAVAGGTAVRSAGHNAALGTLVSLRLPAGRR